MQGDACRQNQQGCNPNHLFAPEQTITHDYRRSISQKKGRSSLRSALGLKVAIGLEGEARRHLNLAARYRRTNERPIRARRRNVGVNDLAELTTRNVANRVSEVRMVQHVVHVGPNRKDVPLRQMEILQDRKVGVEVPRTAEDIPDP